MTTPTDVQTSVARAAMYLDLCDRQASNVDFDAACYLACAAIVSQAFTEAPALKKYRLIINNSPAAKELAENRIFEERATRSRSFYYPELDALMERLAPTPD